MVSTAGAATLLERRLESCELGLRDEMDMARGNKREDRQAGLDAHHPMSSRARQAKEPRWMAVPKHQPPSIGDEMREDKRDAGIRTGRVVNAVVSGNRRYHESRRIRKRIRQGQSRSMGWPGFLYITTWTLPGKYACDAGHQALKGSPRQRKGLSPRVWRPVMLPRSGDRAE